MEYLTINYALNQTFNVHQNVFLDLIKKNMKQIPACTLLKDPLITIVEKGEAVKIELEVKVKKGANVTKVFKKLTTMIENYSLNIINNKPSNIKIILKN